MRLVIFALAMLMGCADAPAEPAEPPGAAPAAPSDAARQASASAESDDVAPPADPEVIARGTFAGASGHDTAGEARLVRDADGRTRVKLVGFSTDRGPDLEVWLVRRTSGDLVRGGLDLGDLQSTRGDQTYAVPPDVDAETFAGVSIWCDRFNVNFGTAPLR